MSDHYNSYDTYAVNSETEAVREIAPFSLIEIALPFFSEPQPNFWWNLFRPQFG